MKQIIKKALGKLGYRISSTRHRPDFETTGFIDPFDAKKYLLNGDEEITVFDAGAYHGVMALHYRKRFSNSTVYCFEPFPDSFAHLKANTENDSNIRIFNEGLSDRETQSRFFSNEFAPTNSLLEADSCSEDVWGKGVFDNKEQIVASFTTIDQFVAAQAINTIDILKLDVQGAEHLVLEGALKTLERSAIRIIYSEVTIMLTYKGQKELHEMLALYKSFGFELHSIYNPSFTPSGAIRQFDCILYRPNT